MEKDIELIEPLSWAEIQEVVGNSRTTFSTNKNKLLKTLIKGEVLIGEMKINSKNLIVINPNLFYKGNKYENMAWLCDVFSGMS